MARRTARFPALLAAVLGGVLAGGCASTGAGGVPSTPAPSPVATTQDRAADATGSPRPVSGPAREPTERSAAAAPTASARPAWLGTRVLPLRDDGFGEVTDTPAELRDRRLVTVDHLPPPSEPGFEAAVRSIPSDVAERSTWREECPVALDELRYVTVVFHGFDARPHTGELLVHADVAGDVVEVFRRLYEARFPIEAMRVVAPAELDAPPTGDGNNTTAFVCRPTRGAAGWSQHAYGLAIDVNPFHNPYAKDDLVLPELASAYTDRHRRRPGMIRAGDAVTGAFADIGWEWGGDWRSLKDWMHFSRDGT